MNKQEKMDGLIKSFLVSCLVLLTLALMVFGAGVLIPLAVAILIWFLINAVANGFQKLTVTGGHMPRSIALALSLATTLGFGFFALDLVVTNLSAMSTRTIDFESSLSPLIDKVADWAGLSNREVLNKIFDTVGIEKFFGKIVSATASFSGQLGVILVYVIFLLIEQQFFDVKLRALIRDEAKREQVQGILKAIAHDVQSYMWIMTTLSALTAALSYFVMRWIGLEHAAFWAFLIFILNFIPTVGSILSTALPALFALVQFQNFTEPLELLVGIGAIQFVIGNFLQPRLAGQSLNLSQFVVILSLFIWGAIWGVVGMFLAVPITAILMIVMSNFESTQPIAILLSQSGNISSPRLGEKSDG